jgi:formylglycine-generating enzyme
MPEKLLEPHFEKDFDFWMLPVDGDVFEMGSVENPDLTFGKETPSHKVELGSFWIGEFPVTQDLYEAVMGKAANKSYFKGARRPVENVSWEEANLFISELNEKTKESRPDGTVYCLPTEAEWEFAARGGRKRQQNEFAGSNKLNEVGWFDDNSHDETKPVRLKMRNELDLFDMSGNVWEWCFDWFSQEYYEECHKNGIEINPNGPKTGSDRVMRGGSCLDPSRRCRVAYRNFSRPSYRYHFVGFRLVLASQSVAGIRLSVEQK